MDRGVHLNRRTERKKQSQATVVCQLLQHVGGRWERLYLLLLALLAAAALSSRAVGHQGLFGEGQLQPLLLGEDKSSTETGSGVGTHVNIVSELSCVQTLRSLTVNSPSSPSAPGPPSMPTGLRIMRE